MQGVCSFASRIKMEARQFCIRFRDAKTTSSLPLQRFMTFENKASGRLFNVPREIRFRPHSNNHAESFPSYHYRAVELSFPWPSCDCFRRNEKITPRRSTSEASTLASRLGMFKDTVCNAFHVDSATCRWSHALEQSREA
jgi:hypothetical protein